MKDLKIYGAIKKYAELNSVRFHMPAHKGKKFLSFNAKYDITELAAIDNAKVVESAEKDCAEILGAKKVLFLTGGSTSGILSAVYAVKDKGKKIIINRSAHKSVYNALKLFNIEPVILDDDREKITPEQILRTFKEEKEAFAALLTYPDYFGRVFDIKGIKSVCESSGKILIIDGAHGNHFKFIGLPYAGQIADISVESLHKTAYSFNQGAIICVNRENLFERVKEGTEVFLTTSPSYPLLASIEYGIKRQAKDNKRTQKIIGQIKKAKKALINNGIKILSAEDPFKITVLTDSIGFNGLKLAEILEKKNIFAELTGEKEILFMFSPANTGREIKKLVKTLLKAVKNDKNAPFIAEKQILTERKRVMPYLKAVNSEYEFTPVENVKGKICAENFGIIPPCSPLFIAGELVNTDVTDKLKNGETFGVYGGKVKTVKVK